MNFLAHIFLSNQNDLLKIGNFIGDFVKGKQLEKYNGAVKKGILLHRMIDDFTDNHPTVLMSKKRLRPKYRHFAPVIVDVYYDHFLARYWSEFSDQDLKTFTQEFYQLTEFHSEIIPRNAMHMLGYMKRDDWLYNYQFLDGIQRALTGMSQRTPYESHMEKSVKDLENSYDEFKEEFMEFFPDLEQQSQNFLNAS